MPAISADIIAYRGHGLSRAWPIAGMARSYNTFYLIVM